MRNQKAKRNLEDTYLIVGFGNPGKGYQNTRHNLGFKAVDLFCSQLGLHLSDRRFQALSSSTNYHGKKIVVACPQTFMNLSGLSVKYLFDYYTPEVRNLMVIHDDLDLDVGRLKIVRGGGAGGRTAPSARATTGAGSTPTWTRGVLRTSPTSPPMPATRG